MHTDILFINPGNHKKTYQDLAKEYTAVATPVWTLLLAHYVRKKGYSTRIYDVNVEGWDEDTAKEVISTYNPELIVLMVYGHQPSASTQTMPAAGRIARNIKACNKDIPVIMGGTHISALPEKTMREEAIDFGIQGEGTYTIEGVMEYLKGKRDLHQVSGLWYRKNDAITFTSPALITENLDEELDGYAWDLLPDFSHYRAHNMHCFQYFKDSKVEDFSDVRTPYATMNTSLGCPYNCHYCCINTLFNKPGIRYWSLEKVMSWIDTLVNTYKIKNLRFDDELFILSPERIERFCDMVIERGYDLNIWAYGRVDTIKESLLKKLKQAGVNWICLGIESGNKKIRESVNKKISKDINGVVRMIQDHDIYVLGNFMFGLPEDDLSTMQDTLDLAVELNCEFVNFYSVMAYPGSRLYEDAATHEGYLPKDWEGFSQYGYEAKPLPTKYLPAKEVLRFRDEAFLKYHENEAYLSMVVERFGEKVRKHIEKMLHIKLRRRILEE